MSWKVKEVKEFLEDKHDEDIVLFYEINYGREYPSEATITRLSTRKPKRTEFEHEECKHCETVTIKDNNRLYCSRNDELLKTYNADSCDDFQHKHYELEYLE